MSITGEVSRARKNK